MNNKKNINANYIKVYNNDQSSLNELKKINNNDEIFNVLNKRKFFNKTIYQYMSKNKKLSQDDKNRTIKRKIEKEKNEKNICKSKKNANNINSCKKGNVFCFIYINNNPLFVLGQQFYYPIIIILFNNIIFLLFIKFIYIRIKHIFQLASFSLLIIVDFTQLYTVLINPGIPKKVWFLSNEIINIIIKDENVYKEFNSKNYKICRKCNLLIYKYLKIIHCDICNVCCEYYDHHCPWIGKCIGKNNYLSFKAFLFSNIIYIILQIVILFIYLINNK